MGTSLSHRLILPWTSCAPRPWGRMSLANVALSAANAVALTRLSRQLEGRARRHAMRPRAVRALAIGATALGAVAMGALAIGALSIGALAVGRLRGGDWRLARLRIDSLDVAKWTGPGKSTGTFTVPSAT
ncbi:hypothetical protein MYSTI_06565 [Myxococcus stipitatus DSM 14675]|uniref:Uncharacterized protein n=1 Tax=Myxococcus stipitatus (strain DSM 14675 / JCM 12634 / Mx s8) TaxID=1278073 RepID=L7UIJ7_MYXSD|nr:hypothetical protein [Myxococcus stipitatus]AGC47838.1 hypothetical protein MYSTI_06565 [Myxococcus stipitatus DSM 14675]